MATRYNFVHDDGTTVLIEQNQVWEQENCNEQDQTHYSDAMDVTLTEGTNKPYIEDDGNNDSNNENETHYFSILDNTNDMDLNEITQPGMVNVAQGANESNTVDMSGQEIVLFRIDGSDDLYGLQVAQDEEGNLQKFQFKVRQNEEGNFEAIPETVQLSPIDCDLSQLMQRDTLATESIEEAVKNSNELIKRDYTDDDDVESTTNNDQQYFATDEQTADEYEYEDEIDIKPNVLAKPFIAQDINIERMLDRTNERDRDAGDNMTPLNENDEIHDDGNLEDDEDNERDMCPDDNIEHIFVKDETILDHHGENRFKFYDESEDLSQSSQEEEYEEEEEIEFEDDEEECYTELDDIEDDDEEYHIINDRSNVIIPDDTLETHRILKVQKQPELIYGDQSTQNATKFNTTKSQNRKVLVVKSIVEKENVSHNIKTNPRSILKSSQPFLKRIVEQKPQIEDERFEKRFAKSKEAIRAKLFQNFIAQTKIIEAPIRTERLPRKQVIRPVNRTDEEIIVQEVYVPSNGYHHHRRSATKISETIQLSDSDEDYDPRKSNNNNNNNQVKRKRKRRKSLIEITSTSEDESEEESSSGYVVDLSFSDSDVETIIVDKKKRGRPSKKSLTDDEEDDEVEEEEENMKETHVPAKRGRGRPPKAKYEEEPPKNNTNKCMKCLKTFPSTSSLKTHMQYHNFKETNRRLASSTFAPIGKSSTSTTLSSSYKCDLCDETFKNHVQLARHKNTFHNTEITCNICKKQFKYKTQLATHKRSHLKDQMFKSTVTVNVTPSKLKRKQSSTLSSNVSLVKQLTCSYCRKILPSQLLLRSHIKNNHERFACKFCCETFVSKFILDNHVSKNCVKKSSRSSFVDEEKIVIKPSNFSNKRSGNVERKTLHVTSKVSKNVALTRKSTTTSTTQRNKLITIGVGTRSKLPSSSSSSITSANNLRNGPHAGIRFSRTVHKDFLKTNK